MISGQEEFFNVTKLMHNSLQGDPQAISDQQWEVFEAYNVMNAQTLEGEWDVIIVHDPQPAGFKQHAGDHAPQLDLALPHRPLGPEPVDDRAAEAADHRLRRHRLAPAAVRARGPRRRAARICPPAIDPLSPKNMALSPEDAAFVCEQFGIDTDRPLICQVSRFDPWKDPMGVIDAYRQVRESIPDAQLALVGSMATDDPEGWDFFHRTFRHADGDPDIKILNNLNNVGAIEVNAFQSQADICMQKSIREGFGLTVTEALWKGRPTIGGDVGGIPLQIDDGVSGFLVDSPEARGAALDRDPRGSRAREAARSGGQGARPRALPHAAPAARLARPVHRARHLSRV